MKKILVVDDSATSRAILRACLPKDTDVELFEADCQDQAVSIAMAKSPDICFMDYNLPDHCGTEIAEAILKEKVATRFVLMTANMQKSVVDRAKAIGFLAFIEKPITPEKVSTVLKELQ